MCVFCELLASQCILSLSKTDNLNGCVLNYSLNKSKSHLIAEYFYIYAQYDDALLLCFYLIHALYTIHPSHLKVYQLKVFSLMNLNKLNIFSKLYIYRHIGSVQLIFCYNENNWLIHRTCNQHKKFARRTKKHANRLWFIALDL